MPAIDWIDDDSPLGAWGDDGSARVAIGHDYGGTSARTAVYTRLEGVWRRVRHGSVRHDRSRGLIDLGVGDALSWVRERFGSDAKPVLGVGCKGPTDPSTGMTDPSTHFAWGKHNVVERYREQHPGAFGDVIAANDLMACALGVSLSPDVRTQIANAVSTWNALHPDDPLRDDSLNRDVAVVSLGTGAGYKVIGPDGRVGEGGEVWTLYAPVDLGFMNWLWEKYRSSRDAERYPLHVERYVSALGLPIFYEYLLVSGRAPDPDAATAIRAAHDVPGAISEHARRGCSVCQMAFVHLGAHIAALAQGIVQAHKPRAVVLSGASLVAQNWPLLEEPFLRYFRRDFGGKPVEFPLAAESRIGLREWVARTAVAVGGSPMPGVDGAAYLAVHADFYRSTRASD